MFSEQIFLLLLRPAILDFLYIMLYVGMKSKLNILPVNKKLCQGYFIFYFEDRCFIAEGVCTEKGKGG